MKSFQDENQKKKKISIKIGNPKDGESAFIATLLFERIQLSEVGRPIILMIHEMFFFLMNNPFFLLCDNSGWMVVFLGNGWKVCVCVCGGFLVLD